MPSMGVHFGISRPNGCANSAVFNDQYFINYCKMVENFSTQFSPLYLHKSDWQKLSRPVYIYIILIDALK